jgi:hypothetical protein
MLWQASDRNRSERILSGRQLSVFDSILTETPALLGFFAAKVIGRFFRSQAILLEERV